MNRRHFLVLAASVADIAAFRASVRAQEQTPTVALLVANAEQDDEGRARAAAFRDALRDLGWTDGRNLRIVVRWRADTEERAMAHAQELLKLRPDIFVVNGSPALSALRRATRNVPVVFVVVADPVGSGFVRSLGRPTENVTGFSTFAPEIGGKWLGLLKEIAPGTVRVACILDPDFRAFAAIRREVDTAASTLRVHVSTIVFRESSDDLESAVATFAKVPSGGLMALPTALNNAERKRIVSLASRYRLPAVYPFRHFADAGGLLAYGFDPQELFTRSAGYVDRILRGERVGELPVQAPTRFETIVNLKTARELGLKVPPTLLARADRVID